MIGHDEFGLRSFTAELLAASLIGLALLGPAAAQNLSIPDSTLDAAAADRESASDFRNLLPLLLTSPDRRQLAAELESLIRRGDVTAAENSLNAAIEVGTLAIVLADHVKDPSFLKALQELGIRGEARPAAAAGDIVQTATSDACPLAPTSANLADMQQALEREQSFSSTVSQTLNGLTQEHNALAERLATETETQSAKASEIQQALERERQRSDAARIELARLQEENRSLRTTREQDNAAGSSKTAELEALLGKEREQAAAAARQLAGAQKDLRDLQASRSESMASQSTRVAELEKALARSQTRSDILNQALTEAEEDLRMLQEPLRPSAAPVVFRIAAAGAEPPLAAPVPEDIPVQATASLPASPVAGAPALTLPGAASTPSERVPTSVVVASLPEGIQPLPLAQRSLDPARVLPPAVSVPKSEPNPASEPKPAAAVEPPKAEDRLTARAQELLHKGDVSGARLLLERAMGSGNARAAFLLAETFDPNMLSQLGVRGIRGDAARARELYAQARALGIAQAGERIEALK